MTAVTTSMPAGRVLDRESLDTLFLRYDRAPEGLARERLAAQIDALSHQKYATVSRLYWHVDPTSAKAAAREQGRPILHLRMLGRLDEDLSCANSRLFRATLYANQDVSQLLRERFVLYWSSERPVPRVTIDFGDGRFRPQDETDDTGELARKLWDEFFVDYADDFVTAGTETVHGRSAVHLTIDPYLVERKVEMFGEEWRPWTIDLWLAEDDGHLVRAVYGGPQAPITFTLPRFTIDIKSVDCECPVFEPR